jgi:hypothetical protein
MNKVLHAKNVKMNMLDSQMTTQHKSEQLQE